MKSAPRVSDEQKFLLGYHIHIKSAKGREARMISLSTKDGVPISLSAIREALHKSVDEIVSSMEEATQKTEKASPK